VSGAAVEAVQRAYDALNRRDLDAFFETADPDVVQDWSRAVGPERGVYRGREEVTRFLQSWWDAFDESVIVVDELIDAGGGQVVAVFHGLQRGRVSGAEVQGPGSVLVWSLRDDAIVSATLYQDRDQALAAVSLPE
jgi:ketosteroid isomerase-like protein